MEVSGVDPRTGLDDLEKRKYPLPLSGIKPRFLGRPVRSVVIEENHEDLIGYQLVRIRF